MKSREKKNSDFKQELLGIYDFNDLLFLQGIKSKKPAYQSLQTLDELLDRDKQREEDGFPRRIKIGKISKPGKGKKDRIVIVPTTAEPKFYHYEPTKEEDETGGSGEGDEGEVIGEQEAQPQQGQGDGSGPGQGEEGGHDITSQAYELGKVLTEKFKLPNLKDKGRKRSLTKFKYDLTDRHRGYGQIIDKKATLTQVIKTNILLGRIKAMEPIQTDELLMMPDDNVYRILSKETDYDNQAVVFFVRDYSGSMQGGPTEAITSQHLFIYSWLMFQYKNNVEARFILHDSKAKEVEDFYTYYNSSVAGGTNVHPAFELVNDIVSNENLAKDNNIYIFYGTDGDDWEEDGKQAIKALQEMITYANRVGITIAKNSWSGSAMTTVERYMDNSRLLKEKKSLIKLDSLEADSANDNRLIEGIKTLIS